jgi:hypothetical protein
VRASRSIIDAIAFVLEDSTYVYDIGQGRSFDPSAIQLAT